MRYVCPAAITAVLLSVLSPLTVVGQGVQGLSITNYQFVSEQRWSSTQSYVTYRADLANAGAARTAVTASVTSLVPEVQVVQGQGNLHFSPVPANSQVTSSNSFTIFVDRSVPFSFDNLQWSFVAPVANAGLGQTVKLGSTVTLDGSGSTNPSGVGTLVYSWTFVSRPVGTGAILFNSDTVKPNFVVDAPGNYTLALTVSNGAGSDTSTVIVSTTNSAPVANAGPNQTVAVNALVTLNGSGSSDADGDPLTYAWTMISRPANSVAALAGANTLSPVFAADKPGTYIVQLVVNDGKVNSLPSNVTIATQNTPPVANAGPNQIVTVASLVQLNGSGSTDVDGNPLTYRWSLLTIPVGSTAHLSNPAIVNPTFTADLSGSYIAQLIVNDGFVDSTPATVSITTNPTLAPTANAGPNQTVAHRATVQLSGSGTDPQGLTLTYAWSLTTKPPGSNAVLLNPTVATPTFVADFPGTYVAQLIVNNGYLSSAPATVTVTTTNTAPFANAGANQAVTLSALVTLNGSGSTDADGDPLTYNWSFQSRPAGSTATLSSATTVSPTFITDVSGTYVVQLIVNDGFANSAPSTATITTGTNTIRLTPNPLNLSPGKVGTLTVTLGAAAGPAGQIVSLAISDPNVATIPITVTIPAGLTGANATVTAGSGLGTATILANSPGYSLGVATVNILVPTIAVSLDSGTVGITHTVNGTITLTAPAPAGGVTVSLSANPSGTVTLQPASVPIAAGSTTGSFIITGQTVGAATISATAAGYTDGSANVTVGMLGAISLPTNVTVGPGQAIPYPVKLATGAPTGGVTVTLTSTDTSTVTISPSTVFIPALDTKPAVQPQATGIKVGSANVVASAPGFFGDTQPVQVAATLGFSPQVVTMGVNSTQNLTLSLSGSAPAGGLVVNLSSSNPSAASVPGSVTILANTTSVAVPVTATGLGQAVIHASALPAFPDTTANITVVNFGAITVPPNTLVGLGQSVPFPVTLPIPAPAGGVTITLTSSDPTKVTITPSTIAIAVGQTTPAAQPQVNGLALGSANVSASANGYSPATGTVQVTASMSLSPQNLTITGTTTQNLTLTLSAPAPAGGLTANVSSSNPSVATVPATVTFPANATSAPVPVTGVTFGATVIHASATNIADTTANVTVQGAGAITLPAGVTVGLTQSTALAITLTSAAPAGGLTVALSSSDPSKVTVSTASVTIPAGQTTPATQPQVTGVNLGTATINATAAGFTAGSTSVLVTASISFSPPTLTITGLGTQNLTLTLSAPAPASVAISVNSSNPSVATVPSSVTFPPNTTTVSVPVTAIASGNTVIHASALPNIADATANVTVQAASASINLPPTLTLGLGQPVALNISLSAAAPAGGVTIALSSSDTSKVTVSVPTVTIPAGQTTPATPPQITGLNFGTAAVTASASGYTAGSSAVTVTGSLSFSPLTLTIGPNTTQNLTLNLSGPAPAGGLIINVSSSNSGVATVPSTVSFAANASSVSVPVTGVANGSVVIHASALPNLADTTATVTVQAGAGIVLPSNVTVEPGQSVEYPVTLSSPAPAGGVFVTLNSSDTSIATLSFTSVFIVEGQTAPGGTPRLSGINYGTATISASANGFTTASRQVSVGASLTFIPPSITIVGGGNQNVGLSLSSFAPAGGLVVNLSSSKPGVATVPASLTIPANATSVSVLVTSVGAGSTTITASTSLPTIPAATAAVTVAAPGTINLANNLSVGLSQSTTLAISLGTPAPAGGLTVTLASGDTSKVVISPTSVFILAGATTPGTQPQVTGTDIGTATISASANGYNPANTTVTVNATMAFSPQSLTIPPGTILNAMLTLSGAVPFGSGLSIPINLSSSNPAVATVPANLAFFPDGSSVMSLVVPMTGVGAGTAVIHASALPFIPDTTLTITVPSPGAIVLPSSVTLAPGQSAILAVSLGTPAPAGGVNVALSSSDTTKVTVSPTSISIAAGQTTPATQPQVFGINFGTVNIAASAPGYNSASTAVQVTATIGFSPQNSTITANTTSNLALTLSAPAPAGGLAIALSSSNPLVASVPGSVLFGASATTVNVPVTGISSGFAVITASAAAPNIANAAANVTVGSAPSIILPSNVSVGLGQSTPVAITLGTPAPLGGITVALASSDNSKAIISPATVTIDAGQTTPGTQPQASGINIGAANISASASGYNSASAPVQVTAVIGFTPPGAPIIAGTVQNVTLNLSAPAPASITVNLSSDTQSVATVPATATFPAGATTVSVPVTGVVPGNAVIHASLLPFIADATAGVTVQNPSAILLPANATVGLGQSTDFNVTLPNAAPAGGVTISLSSANTSKVTIAPSTIFIAVGQMAPATQPKVTGVDLGTANINAAASGFTPASAPVQVTATLNFSPPTLTVVGTATQNLTLTLSALAPAGGLTINLNSTNPSVATVPSTVVFAGNTNSVTVPVTGVTPGTTTIHASALPNVADVAANVTVASPGTINLPPSVSVGPNQSAPLAVTLGTPAPAGGVMITLISSDTTKVTISPASLTIDAGQTTPSAQPQVTGVNFGTANISATASGYTPASAAVQVTATLGFAAQNVTISGLVQQTLTLNLSAPAPAAGVTINLNSSNPSIVTVPDNVVFPANATSVNVTVTAVALGGPVTIHASSLPNLADTTTNVTVQSAGALIVPSNTTVVLGQSASFAVALPGPAPAGGVTVALASSDTSRVTISPATVNIPAGQTAPSTQPQVTGINPSTASINVSASGYTSASGAVQVTATINFAPNSLTINGLTTQNLTLNLSGTAPAGGLSVNLSSDNPALVSVPATVSFAPNTNSAIVPVTGVAVGGPVTIRAGAAPSIAETTASVTVQSAGPIGLPAGATVGLGQSATFAVTLPLAAPAGGTTVNLSSADPSKVTVLPATVNIAAGQITPSTQPQVTGVNLGTATINVSAPGYTPASAPVQVTGTINFAPNTLTISGFNTQNLTLNLSGPAPAGGLVINTSSSNTAVATVPATVTFTAGATTVNVPVTGVAIGGPATIHANAPNLADTSATVTVQSAGPIGVPANVSLSLGQLAALTVTLPAPAPPGGVNVTLTSSDASKVAVTTTVSIAGGQTTPAAPPQMSGANLGTASITVSAPGYTSASTAVTVTASLTFSPNTLVINGITTANLLLTLSAPAPAGGLTVNLFSSDPSIVNVQGSATFTAGQTGASVQVTAFAAGSAVIHASAAPFIPDTTAGVTVAMGGVGTISLASASIGKDLAVTVLLSISSPAPAGGLPITLSTSDSSKVLIGQNSPIFLGVPSFGVSIPAGGQSVLVSLQGLASSGTATVSATAAGWSTGFATITLTPSGFALAPPNGIGVTSIATNAGISTPMTVFSVRLDPSFNYVEPQTLRGGATMDPGTGAPVGGLFVTVPLGSSDTNIGTISKASVQFTGGDTSSVGATFTALAPGNVTITAGTPGGFSTPVNVNSVTANIGAFGLVPGSVTVGRNLEAPVQVALNGAPNSDVFMTISSDDSTKALLSTTPDGIVVTNNVGVYVGGQTTISVKVKAGFNHTPDFYVFGLASSGSTTYTATLNGFGTAQGTISFAPSGISIAGPFGAGATFSATPGGAPVTLTLTTGILNSGGVLQTAQAVSGQFQNPLGVAVTSGNTTVGTIATSPVAIAAGSSSGTTQFQPLTVGSSTISVNPPTGFSSSSTGLITANVATAGIGITDNVSIGKNLAYNASLALGQTPPPGGVKVHLSTNSPGRLKLAVNVTDAGSDSIDVTVFPPFTSAQFFLYALDNAGTASYTASAPGYLSRTATAITLTSSAIVLSADGINPGGTLLAQLSAGKTPFFLIPVPSDINGNLGQSGQLAGGQSVIVTLDSNNKAAGTVPAQVTLLPGSGTTVQFTAVASGSTSVSITGTPSGFVTPAFGGSLTAFVF